jgi:hypothetical protein
MRRNVEANVNQKRERGEHTGVNGAATPALSASELDVLARMPPGVRAVVLEGHGQEAVEQFAAYAAVHAQQTAKPRPVAVARLDPREAKVKKPSPVGSVLRVPAAPAQFEEGRAASSRGDFGLPAIVELVEVVEPVEVVEVVEAPVEVFEGRGRRRRFGTGRRRGARRTQLEAKREAEEAAWGRRFEARCEAEFAASGEKGTGEDRVLIPKRVWVMAWSIMSDHSKTGEVCRQWLRWSRGMFSGAPLALIMSAALCTDKDGRGRYDWRQSNARGCLVVALALLMMGKPRLRRGEWTLCVRGVVRKTLCALAAQDDSDEPRSLSWLVGQWGKRHWEQGAMRRLEAVGFVRRSQVPAHAGGVADFEKYRDRNGVWRTSNRYWLTWKDTASTHGFDLAKLHAIGWELCESFVRRAPRTLAGKWRELRPGRARAPD